MDAPAIFLHLCRIHALAAEDRPTCLLRLNLTHDVLLCDANYVLFGRLERPQPDCHLLLIRTASCEKRQSLRRGVLHSVNFLEGKQLCLIQLLLGEVSLDDTLDTLLEVSECVVAIWISIRVEADDTAIAGVAACAICTALLSDSRQEELEGQQTVQD